jgi:hypothetical protein
MFICLFLHCVYPPVSALRLSACSCISVKTSHLRNSTHFL